jgi:hypothetical protein
MSGVGFGQVSRSAFFMSLGHRRGIGVAACVDLLRPCPETGFAYPDTPDPAQYPAALPLTGPISMGPVPFAPGLVISPSLRVVCYSLAMSAPHFGHLRSTQGTPRSCGARCPHFVQRQAPPLPAARGPPMRPRPCPPRPWPCPPPFPIAPSPFPLGPVPSPLGIVVSSVFRIVCYCLAMSTPHLTATSSAVRLVWLIRTHLPSNRYPYSILFWSILKLSRSICLQFAFMAPPTA